MHNQAILHGPIERLACPGHAGIAHRWMQSDDHLDEFCWFAPDSDQRDTREYFAVVLPADYRDAMPRPVRAKIAPRTDPAPHMDAYDWRHNRAECAICQAS